MPKTSYYKKNGYLNYPIIKTSLLIRSISFAFFLNIPDTLSFLLAFPIEAYLSSQLLSIQRFSIPQILN